MTKQQPPKQLDAIVDVVLAYRPKAKSKPRRKRKRRAGELSKGCALAGPESAITARSKTRASATRPRPSNGQKSLKETPRSLKETPPGFNGRWTTSTRWPGEN